MLDKPSWKNVKPHHWIFSSPRKQGWRRGTACFLVTGRCLVCCCRLVTASGASWDNVRCMYRMGQLAERDAAMPIHTSNYSCESRPAATNERTRFSGPEYPSRPADVTDAASRPGGCISGGPGGRLGPRRLKNCISFSHAHERVQFILALACHSRQITGDQAEVMTSIHGWTFRNYFAILPEVAFQGNHHSSARRA